MIFALCLAIALESKDFNTTQTWVVKTRHMFLLLILLTVSSRHAKQQQQQQQRRRRRWRIVGIFKISKVTFNSFPCL